MVIEAAQEPCVALGARARSELDREAAVERVIAAMHDRIDQPFPLDEMARIAYLSRFYFNRVFREVTGLPPVRFHTALRIAQAKRLLTTTELSVTEICLDVGYQSLGTFTTHFHELVGVSPREFRRTVAVSAPGEATVAAIPAADPDSAAPSVEGVVLGVAPAEPVFVGLFRHPYPQGLPHACTILRGSGRYVLTRPSADGGTFYVAAASWSPDEPPLVAVTQRPVRIAPGRVSRRDLQLRRLRLTDPPILLALPVGSDGHDHGTVGHQPMPKAAGTLITQ